MRWLIFAILVAIPTALITWAVTLGLTGHQKQCEADVEAGSEPEAREAASLAERLSAGVGEFRPLDEVRAFDSESLFDHINGAAPSYIDRGFEKLVSVDLRSSAGAEAVCDVYDMGSPAGASAIFTLEKSDSARELEVGDAAWRARLALVMRYERYYVKLTAFDEEADAQLERLATELLERL